MIRLFNYCSNIEVLMFSSCTNTPPTTRLSMLTYLSPSAISAATLSSTFPKSSSHFYCILPFLSNLESCCKFIISPYLSFAPFITFSLQYQLILYVLPVHLLRVLCLCFPFKASTRGIKCEPRFNGSEL